MIVKKISIVATLFLTSFLFAQPTIIITEILAYEDEALQFIELYNQTPYQIDLNKYGLTISSSPDFRGYFTYKDEICAWPGKLRFPSDKVVVGTTTIGSYQYAVILSTPYAESKKIYDFPYNTLILTTTDYMLSKKGLWSTDRIRLSQPNGVIISTFGSTFKPETSWGISIERKGDSQDGKVNYHNDDIPANWATSRSLTGSTPGARNSVVFSQEVLRTDEIIKVTDSPFYPYGDHPFKRFAKISYNVPKNTTVTLKIFDVKGNLIITPIDQESNFGGLNRPEAGLYCVEESGYWKGTFYWNGRDIAGKIVPIGVYICYIEAVEKEKGMVHKGKAGVVVGRKLN